MLVNWVESYVKLREEEALEFRRLLDLEENREIRTMELTWLGKAEARGMEIATDRMRQAVLRQIEQRFGRVPKRAQKRVAAIKSIEPLAELVEKILVVRSLKELGLS